MSQYFHKKPLSFVMKWLRLYAICFIRVVKCLCPPIQWLSYCVKNFDYMKYVGFAGGFALGQVYDYFLLKKIPFPDDVGQALSLGVSLILGIGNAICVQLRCISLLTFPMYCGKPGRGVLKAVVLTYVVAGPITNMCLNAKEVVRVFGCSHVLSYNVTRARHAFLARPFRSAVLSMRSEVNELKDTLGSFGDVVAPIKTEIEDMAEVEGSRKVSDDIDELLGDAHRSLAIDKTYEPKPTDKEKSIYMKLYQKKLEYRCQEQLSLSVAKCTESFAHAFDECSRNTPEYAGVLLCWPLRVSYICNVMHFVGGQSICNSTKQIDPGLEEGYDYLLKLEKELTEGLEDIKLQYKIQYNRELTVIQDAKETSERVMHAFKEKSITVLFVIDAVNACVAVLFLRILLAAGAYHDHYLTGIGYDNVYITQYFKTIDRRRRNSNKHTLLPLKKMERIKYIDVDSLAYIAPVPNKLVTQMLKVMLEVITATTFVMLDRLFYEALDVVCQHADVELEQQGSHDLDIQVEGPGMLASLVRKILSGVNEKNRIRCTFSNRPCLPRARLMPPTFFLKIYGGYLWILLLLYFNPYTLRLNRLICSWFYPRREKQRILHLYNDILKKRIKMQKTLRRKAVQAVRAHYLSGENLLSLRMKFPQLLGWLQALPAARMTCLICGETEPRRASDLPYEISWKSCPMAKCPFVYCAECWVEVERRCLACEPSLAELSDVDSLSDDDQPRY